MSIDPNSILADRNRDLHNHSSWHLERTLEWLDYAKRTHAPGAVGYAAYEMRQGIEYLLFHLLVISSETLSENEYQDCFGPAKNVTAKLAAPGVRYKKLSQFTKAIFESLRQPMPPMKIWDTSELLRYWGTASEYLHFRGTHSRSVCDPGWIDDAVSRLSPPAKAMHEVLYTTLAIGTIKPSGMNPASKAVWEDFRDDRITLEQAEIRLKLVHP
jgi:hypothetical protein